MDVKHHVYLLTSLQVSLTGAHSPAEPGPSYKAQDSLHLSIRGGSHHEGLPVSKETRGDLLYPGLNTYTFRAVGEGERGRDSRGGGGTGRNKAAKLLTFDSLCLHSMSALRTPHSTPLRRDIGRI